MYHRIFNTQFGKAAIIFDMQPFILNGTLLPQADSKTLIQKIDQSSARESGTHKLAERIVEQIQAYFKGCPILPPWQLMELSHLTPLQRAVLAKTAAIPYGETRSYSDIATAVGRPNASRFVGTTMAKNPFPILIPCHRVVKKDRTLGKFGGGTALKAALIAHEKNV